MDSLNRYLQDISQVSAVLEEEENLLQEMNADLDKQVAKDMQEIQTLIIPDSPIKEDEKTDKEEGNQIVEEGIMEGNDEEENIYISINEELDKQIAKDMEAIQNYIKKNDDSLKSRIEFFNNIDSSHINKCIDRTVTNHILVQHTILGTINWHECTQCEYKAKEKHKLREHLINKHTNTNDTNWFLCHRCTYMTINKPELHKHLKNVHGENPEPSYKCDRCDSKYFKESDLFQHKHDAHNVEVFSCEQCEYQTMDESDLRQHKMTHLKLNFSWYKCAQCTYRALRKATLDRHIMYKHSVF